MSQSSLSTSAGGRFRAALAEEKPLQIVGVINAYAALLAEKSGFRAPLSTRARAWPTLLTACPISASLRCAMSWKMSAASRERASFRCWWMRTPAGAVPWAFNARSGKWHGPRGGSSLGGSGGEQALRPSPGKELVNSLEMCDRIEAAVDAKADPLFVIMARTDAAAGEGLEAAIERAGAYARAGADMIFAEALGTLQEYSAFCRAVRVPVLANLTEFGKTPLFTLDELASAGVSMALYPLSAFRAMSAAALEVFRAIRRDGTQKSVVGKMQSRADLYEFLDYTACEAKLDELFTKETKS